MKIVKFTAVALFVALLAVGCANEKISFGNDGVVEISNKGTLSVSQLVVDCRVDERDPNGGIDPSASSVATRTSVDANNFACSIINEEGKIVKSFKYGERPTENIELETGDYIFKIQSGDVPNVAWDTPVYGASKAFKIVRDKTTTLSEIVCSLMQIKVTITYAPDLLERLDEATTTTVNVGSSSLVFSLSESRAGFFLAPQSNNTIELNIKGRYAADKVNFKDVEMNKMVENVKVGLKVPFVTSRAISRLFYGRGLLPKK